MAIGELSGGDHLVEPQARPVPFAVAEPADAGRQPLERHRASGQREPSGEMLVLGEQFEHGPIGGRDVRGIARQRDPPERSAALLEQRTEVRRDEAGKRERPVEAALAGLVADRVAVVEHLGAAIEEPDHGFHMPGHRPAGLLGEPHGVLRREGVPLLDRHPAWQVGQRVVGRGLVGDDVDRGLHREQRRHDVGGVSDHSDRAWLPQIGRAHV